ncbi:MAG: preprotein translocase subunit SecE [Candidatus Nanopelagicales bacterium]|nr:preprotein translocase subunit SecE [Candidatus Nanopelagicales bacterium]MCF8539599.1 preprotein translocase subunit SecE [Candidatus Nanopelagicales bacterium]MCF8551797.1 preprotein translocase subunit SecE [Candidatus Nanopelagicales bacterium]
MVDTDAKPDGGRGGSGAEKKNIFSRLALFIRQVVVELRKVIWPTRNELVNYTIVVLFFVLLMSGIIALYDYVFTQGVLFVFG